MKADDGLGKLRRFHDKRLLLDANLLLPYLMGCFYRVHQEVQRHAAFKEEEFTLLAQIIERFKHVGAVLTTPHLLTEVSSVSKELRANRVAFLSFVRPFIQELDEMFDSKRTGAHRLARHEYFPLFGLADSALIDLAYDSLVILTNDRPMARYLQKEKGRRNVLYFGDLKERYLNKD